MFLKGEMFIHTDVPAEVLQCPWLQNHWVSLQSVGLLSPSLLCCLGQCAGTGAVDVSKTGVKCSCLTLKAQWEMQL